MELVRRVDRHAGAGDIHVSAHGAHTKGRLLVDHGGHGGEGHGTRVAITWWTGERGWGIQRVGSTVAANKLSTHVWQTKSRVGWWMDYQHTAVMHNLLWRSNSLS